MKKLFVLAFITMLCVACSIEEETTLDEGTNLEVELENYKGVFTTTDGLTRGALDVTLSEDELSATGTLTLSTGEVVSIFTDQIIDVGNRKEIEFTSNELSFIMTTGAEEEIMEIEAVTFRGTESSILVGQSSSRAPLDPILGTFICIDCPAPLDNGSTQTFNFLVSAADMSGNSTVTSQTTLAGTVYNGVATQSGCVVSGDQTTCNLNSGTVPGVTGTAFNPGGGPVTWSGTHTFNNGPSGGDDCSTASGTWTWTSSTIGTVGGNFTSNISGDCPPPVVPPTVILFENFETAIGTPPSTGYVVRNEFVPGSAVEYSLAPAIDYFGRITTAEFTGGEVNITNVQGSRFFGAADIDQSGNPNGNNFDIGSINWFNLDVSALSSISASAFFAEANESGSETWDANSSVRIEYSTNNTTWTTLFAIEATSDIGNQAPAIDTNLNGIGNGTVINETLTQYTTNSVDVSSINTISIRIIFEGLNAAREDIAVDNFTISGN